MLSDDVNISNTKQWDTVGERLLTATKPHRRREQTALKILRKRVDNLSIVCKMFDVPCTKDLAAMQTNINEIQNQLKIIRQSQIQIQRLTKVMMAEDKIAGL